MRTLKHFIIALGSIAFIMAGMMLLSVDAKEVLIMVLILTGFMLIIFFTAFGDRFLKTRAKLLIEIAEYRDKNEKIGETVQILGKLKAEEELLKTKSFVALENKRMQWSNELFKESTAESALIKLEEEISEIRENLEKGVCEPEEYVDALMCLFDSAGRNGITAAKLRVAFENKLNINLAREWKSNGNGTYSHVKN